MGIGRIWRYVGCITGYVVHGGGGFGDFSWRDAAVVRGVCV